MGDQCALTIRLFSAKLSVFTEEDRDGFVSPDTREGAK